MPRISGLFLSGVAAIALAGQARAETDFSKLTCGQYLSRDTAGRIMAAADLLEWIACDETCTLEGSLMALFFDMDAQEVQLFITDRCTGQPAETNVVARLNEEP